MKIYGITFLMLLTLMTLSIGIDLLMGFELQTTLRQAVSPFIVMETVELTVFLSLIFILIGKLAYRQWLKRKQTQKGSGL